MGQINQPSAAPKVSVVMPVHNGGADLPKAVDCILAQTFREFEFVIIDDASGDSTPEYLASLRDSRIRILRNDRNLGIARSLNRGIRESSGEYIARQDADDLSRPERFEKQVAFLDSHPAVALVATRFYIVQNGHVHGPSQRTFTDFELRYLMLFENPIAHTSVMLRRSACVRAGGYPEDCRLEDYELWSRIAEFAPIACLPEPLVKWTSRPDSYTHSDGQRTANALLAASRKHIGRLLGVDVPHELYDDFLALYRGGGKTPPVISTGRVRAATEFATRLQEAFYARVACGHWEAWRHCARVRARWAGHLVRLAVQEPRDLRWRACLLITAFKLAVMRSA